MRQPRLEGSDSVDGVIAVEVDRTQFALAYEASVIALENLTQHQLEKLADCLWDGMRQLIESQAESGAALHAKFIAEGDTFQLSYGGLDTFLEAWRAWCAEAPLAL